MFKNKIIFFLLTSAFSATFSSCEKQKLGPLSDLRPAVPVTVDNAVYYRPEPTITVPLAGTGAISITLSIPAGSGRTIKEITRVATSTTYSKVQGSSGFYNTAPIAGSGTSVTFTSSLTEYFQKNPASASNPPPSLNNELGLRFYFLITLDDGTVLIPEPVRVLIV
jgi:hypothetical protein